MPWGGDGAALPPEIDGLLTRLIADKARTRELGETEPLPVLERFIEEEFAAAESRAAGLARPTPPPVREEADAVLRRWAFGWAAAASRVP